ncbi:PD-(D/E)XK nuclease family protein [Algibacter lectus]|uniref:PD-(D/E)XK nuclease family protein n=1 Tax=Algibacter lectus TaxID=221126 RepID=UPI0024947136|nr:PD-(D/E)XK nuclease family protein [Algibacter lectus]
MINQPNIFNYATSELSQDAFIAWLLTWADAKYKEVNNQLHLLGLDFLQSLLVKHPIGSTEISNLEIKTQFHKIDVFVSFIMDGKSYGVIIEDKVHTTDHSNQLERYKAKIKELNNHDVLVPVYFKTGYQVNLTRIEDNGYYHYTVKDLLQVLTQIKITQINNDVLTQYHSYLLGKDEEFDNAETDANLYLTEPLSKWKWWTCVRFFHEYKEHFKAGWHSVPNNREPLIAFWYGGEKFTMNDVESDKKMTLEVYSDIQFSRGRIIISYRVSLHGNPQKNNKNRNKIYNAFKQYLDEENISHKKAHFKSAKDTMKLVELTNISDTLNYEGLVSLMENNDLLSKKFAKNFTNA